MNIDGLAVVSHANRIVEEIKEKKGGVKELDEAIIALPNTLTFAEKTLIRDSVIDSLLDSTIDQIRANADQNAVEKVRDLSPTPTRSILIGSNKGGKTGLVRVQHHGPPGAGRDKQIPKNDD